jgi:predicted enzyme related to lactoylglutathione lyase
MQIKPLFLSATLRVAAIAPVAFVGATTAGARAAAQTPIVAVGPQYDSSHVYVAPEHVDRFAQSFLATFGGQGTKPVVATVTPTPSSTTAQLLQTPVGPISLVGFKTPVPYPFGAERNGYLVTDMDVAIKAARQAGADVLVSTFPDAIGRDAVIQWPGGVNMQLYWHITRPAYAALQTIPENRVYVSPDRAAAFVRSFLAFSHGRVVSDNAHAAGLEIGRPTDSYRRIRIESTFGKMAVFVTDGHLPYPYGRETTGYEVADLQATLSNAEAAGVTLIVKPYTSDGRASALVQFPGGYVAEMHAVSSAQHASDVPKPERGR